MLNNFKFIHILKDTSFSGLEALLEPTLFEDLLGVAEVEAEAFLRIGFTPR